MAPQGLHLGGAIEAKQAPEIGRRVLLERLGSLDAQEREEHERQDGRAQAVERRADGAVDVARHLAWFAVSRIPSRSSGDKPVPQQLGDWRDRPPPRRRSPDGFLDARWAARGNGLEKTGLRGPHQPRISTDQRVTDGTSRVEIVAPPRRQPSLRSHVCGRNTWSGS